MSRESVALAFAMLFPSAAAWVYFVAVSPESGAMAANPALQVLYGGSKAVQFIFPLVYLWLCDRRALRAGTITSRGIIPGLLFGVVAGAGILWFFHTQLKDQSLFAGTPDRLRSKVAEFGLNSPTGFLVLAAVLSVVHSFLEEYYWRWFVFARLRRRQSFMPAAVLSALAFMGHHIFVLHVYFPENAMSAVVPFSLAIAFGGFVWAWLYQRSGSLLGPWLSHTVVDGAIMAVGYSMMYPM